MTAFKPSKELPLPLQLEYVDGFDWLLLSPFMAIVGGRTHVVPAGFMTDFNSIPRLLWRLLPPTEYGAAGVIHDWLYHYPDGLTRTEVDDIHGYILKVLGAPRWKVRAYREGLRIGGWAAWRNHRKNDVN